MGALDIADRTWPLLSRLMNGHGKVYRATGGRVGMRLPWLPPILLLDHVGAKSGIGRTTPLLFVRDGENVVIVASKGGFAKHPAWFHNLRANPDTTVQIGREVVPVRARVASGEERARLWPLAVSAYPNYEAYQRRTDREIPVVVLERRDRQDA
jgi:deazaflavin-dependent oxidoreductase (nitroreductase family)